MSSHQKKQRTILDLNRYVKVAREWAILGKYEESLNKYKTALKIIENRLNEVNDPFLKEKWKNVNAVIRDEVINVHTSYEIAKKFINDDAEAERRKREEEMKNNQILMRDYIPQNDEKQRANSSSGNDNEKPAYDKRWAHFGGRPPFSYLNDKDNSADDDKKRAKKILMSGILQKITLQREINQLKKIITDQRMFKIVIKMLIIEEIMKSLGKEAIMEVKIIKVKEMIREKTIKTEKIQKKEKVLSY